MSRSILQILINQRRLRHAVGDYENDSFSIGKGVVRPTRLWRKTVQHTSTFLRRYFWNWRRIHVEYSGGAKTIVHPVPRLSREGAATSVSRLSRDGVGRGRGGDLDISFLAAYRDGESASRLSLARRSSAIDCVQQECLSKMLETSSDQEAGLGILAPAGVSRRL